MGYLKKYSWEVAAGIGILVYFFATRFYNLLQVPMFTDEAIYLYWADVAKNDAAWRFISLTDGKQPLYIWFTVFAMRFVEDPLIAGRIVSIFAGCASLIGLFLVGNELFKNRWIGILSSLLYAVYPFALVYDKMALYDALVATFAVWGLYFVLLFTRRVRLDLAMILGIVGGIGALNKTSGFFTIGLLPFSLFIFHWGQKKWRQRLLKWITLAGVAGVITYVIYAILRLSPFYYIIDQKNAVFVYPLQEWIQHPFMYVTSNFSGLWNWFIIYFSMPFLITVIASFFIDKKFLREKIVLIAWFIVPYTYLAFFGKNIYPRYILFMTLSLLPLVAFTIYHLRTIIKNTWLYRTLCVLLFLSPMMTQYGIVTDFASANIPESDKSQYNNDWPSGTGVKESAAVLDKEAKNQKITVYTQGTFGLMPYAYELYLKHNKNITVKGLWPIKDLMPQEIVDAAKAQPTYIVFYQPCPDCPTKGKAPRNWPLEEIYTIKKVAPDTYLTLYRVLP